MRISIMQKSINDPYIYLLSRLDAISFTRTSNIYVAQEAFRIELHISIYSQISISYYCHQHFLHRLAQSLSDSTFILTKVQSAERAAWPFEAVHYMASNYLFLRHGFQVSCLLNSTSKIFSVKYKQPRV